MSTKSTSLHAESLYSPLERTFSEATSRLCLDDRALISFFQHSPSAATNLNYPIFILKALEYLSKVFHSSQPSQMVLTSKFETVAFPNNNRSLVDGAVILANSTWTHSNRGFILQRVSRARRIVLLPTIRSRNGRATLLNPSTSI